MLPAGLVVGVLALSSLAATGACICPPRAAEVADTGFRTPEQTFRSFQVFLAADLVKWEYRCFSAGFKRRNQLPLANYFEARDKIFRERPWLKWFAEAEIVRDWSAGEGVHVIEARVASSTVHVKLVREDSYEIYSGDRYVADGYVHFEDVVDVRPAPEGPRMTVSVPLQDPKIDPSEATSLVVERTWHIDDLTEAPPQPEP